MKKYYYSIGLMSGTSIDGVDASIIKSDGDQFIEIIDNTFIKYQETFREELKKIISKSTSKYQISRLSKKIQLIEKKLTKYHYKACLAIILKSGLSFKKIDLIGFHGQTILHKPNSGYSIQIGNPSFLSKITKTNVISNFRQNDILNGGQGAPLTPLYHQLILKKLKLKLPAAIVNIGGISNITYINNNNKIISFDTGPGNFLIDQWVSNKSKNKFDKNGLIAKSGRYNKKIVKSFIEKDYYKKKVPKSLDVKSLKVKNLNKLKLKDGCSTLSMLTVETICLSIKNFKKTPKIILFSGGGRKNKFIIENIKKRVKCKVSLIDEYDFNGDFIESQAFAYLSIRSYLKKYITLPSLTGVKNPCLGGKLSKF